MLKRWVSILSVGVVALGTLAACGAPSESGEQVPVTLVAVHSAPALEATKEAIANPPTAEAAAGTATGGATGGGETVAGTVTVKLEDIFFDPKEVTIPANTPIEFDLPNTGASPHDFSIDALKISVAVEPGDTGKVVINAPAGTYEYYCNVPGHKEAGMVGTLTVKEGAPVPGAAAAGAGAAPAASPAAGGEAAAPATSPEAAAPAAATFTVKLEDIFFDPKELTIPANTPVTIDLPNVGAAPHDFSIDALKISVPVEPGDTGHVTINAPAGDYEYYCNVPGHKEAGMVGTLHVVEGAPVPGAAAAASPAAAAPAASPAAEAAPATAAAEYTVKLEDIFFDPKELTIPANTPVTISLPNVGAAPHDFSIDALKISVPVEPGDTGSVTINAPAGTYEYYCNVPGHKEAGMVGTLIVK